MKKTLLMAVCCTAFLLACGGGGSDNTPTAPTPIIVSYEISGVLAGSATVTYRNTSGGTEQKNVSLPRKLPDFTVMTAMPGDFLYVSAQNESASGSVTVKILVNDAVFKQATSSGAYAIATASGSCC
jgi:hypothetical protein